MFFFQNKRSVSTCSLNELQTRVLLVALCSGLTQSLQILHVSTTSLYSSINEEDPPPAESKGLNCSTVACQYLQCNFRRIRLRASGSDSCDKILSALVVSQLAQSGPSDSGVACVEMLLWVIRLDGPPLARSSSDSAVKDPDR